MCLFIYIGDEATSGGYRVNSIYSRARATNLALIRQIFQKTWTEVIEEKYLSNQKEMYPLGSAQTRTLDKISSSLLGHNAQNVLNQRIDISRHRAQTWRCQLRVLDKRHLSNGVMGIKLGKVRLLDGMTLGECVGKGLVLWVPVRQTSSIRM